LIKAADTQSIYMAKVGKMTHDNVGKDKTVGNRVDNAGYTWTNVAENVGFGFTSEDEVMDKWMKSPGHKKNIMDAKVKMIGVAIEMKGDVPYWTQVFASDKSNASKNVPSEEECAKLCKGGAKAKGKSKKKDEVEEGGEEVVEAAKPTAPKEKYVEAEEAPPKPKKKKCKGKKKAKQGGKRRRGRGRK
jgi:hypothetical protein